MQFHLAGLYYKLHGSHRPVNMNKTTIKRRRRVAPSGAEAEKAQSTSRESPESTSGSVQALQDQDQRDHVPSQGGRDETAIRPPRKRARKTPGSIGTDSYNSPQSHSMGLSSPHVGDASLPSSRPNNLTLPELAAVAALAMHSNHQSSLSHSIQLDNETLTSHSHPLHSKNADGEFNPSRSVSAQAVAGPTADRYVERHPSLISEEINALRHLRADLVRENAQAKDSIVRLQTFLNRSDTLLSQVDDHISSMRSMQAGSAEATTAAKASLHMVKRGLADILGSIVPQAAIQSAVLLKRKRNANLPHLQQLAKSPLLNDNSPSRLIWEICPSNSLGIAIVPKKEVEMVVF